MKWWLLDKKNTMKKLLLVFRRDIIGEQKSQKARQPRYKHMSNLWKIKHENQNYHGDWIGKASGRWRQR